MNIKLPTDHHLEFLSLKGGYTGSSESTLVKMSHCWKSHDVARMYARVSFVHFLVGSGSLVCLYFIMIARMTLSVFSHRTKLALRQMALAATLVARFY